MSNGLSHVVGSLSAVTILFFFLASCSPNSTLPGASSSWRVINYWAIWCMPCREEIPELNKLDTSPEITVLAVNFDRLSGERLLHDANQLGIAFQLLDWQDAELIVGKRPSVLPSTYIFAPDGVLMTELIGPQTAEELAALIGSFKKNAD